MKNAAVTLHAAYQPDGSTAERGEQVLEHFLLSTQQHVLQKPGQAP
jgi:hypothetical protein